MPSLGHAHRLFWLPGLFTCVLAAKSATADAQQQMPPERTRAERAVVDRTVVRFTAPETGGSASPRFIFERVLAFEARLEALADPGHRPSELAPYSETHVRTAMERHIAETLLASLAIDPKPSAGTIEAQMTLARAMLVHQLGADRLRTAAASEGIDTQELRRLFRRRALASLYLHHMVAPMLAPRDGELRELHQKTPFMSQPFEKVKPELERLYVSRALAEAVSAFYQNARSRLSVTVL
ncbi:MAG TPA: hypothetical protein VI197_04835 [Polyangiaceae bacterium]